MSRQKTKGSTIGIRLPLAVDDQVRAKALAAGLSPGRYLAARIVKAYPAEEPPMTNVRSGSKMTRAQLDARLSHRAGPKRLDD